MLGRTMSGGKLGVIAFGRGVEVGVVTTVDLSWVPGGNITRIKSVIQAGRIDAVIVVSFLVGHGPRNFRCPQYSVSICEVAKACTVGWLG
jgi:hypothetical protein